MTSISIAFFAELRLAPPGGSEPPLTAMLEAAHSAGARVWAPVELDPVAFARHLAGCVAGVGDPSDFLNALKSLHITDLYLACAAGLGAPHARERFARDFLLPIQGAVRNIGRPSTGFTEDVRQELHERLLLPANGPPKILQYRGRAPLTSWVGVAARRAALQLLRQAEARQKLAEATADEALGLQLEPELQYLKDRYADAFKAAVGAAMARLSRRERMILRLHVVGGLTLARIAIMLAVDESTISRWEKRARESILNETHEHLRRNLGISDAELPSLMRVVSSQLQVSVTRLLASDVDARTPQSDSTRL